VLDLRRLPADHPDALALDTAVQAHYAEVYGSGDETPLDPRQFDPPDGWFTVGYAAGAPVASGGWRARGSADDPLLRDGDAEVKRMYVDPAHRGRGYARAVLAELERTAAAAGRRRLVLETGTRQPEAIALYASAGYLPIPKFGIYRHEPGSRCYAKEVTAAAGDGPGVACASG
jgi:GNAT superfamily N-acetyltransferase